MMEPLDQPIAEPPYRPGPIVYFALFWSALIGFLYISDRIDPLEFAALMFLPIPLQRIYSAYHLQ